MGLFLETLDTRSYTLQMFYPALKKNLFSRVENVSVSVSGSTAVATKDAG